MEYYLTTYTKDYKWPVRHSPIKEKKEAERREKLVEEQSKQEPCMAYLPQRIEDPTIDPAQCGAPPAGPESKLGQPMTYLRKLYLKYPYLYQILKLTPPEELAKTVYADKFISTYTADYKVDGFEPMKGWLMPEEKVTDDAEKSGMEWAEHPASPQDVVCTLTGEATCTAPVQPQSGQTVTFADSAQGDGVRKSCGCIEAAKKQLKKAELPTKRISKKPCAISSIPRAPRDPPVKKREETKRAPAHSGGAQNGRASKWKTEYRDTISKLGTIIIQKKLLSRLPPELKTTAD